MTTGGWGVYTMAIEEITAEVLTAFLDEQRTERLMAESMTLELKRRRSGTNVAKAVAALANTSGGVVIVGVDEDEPDLSSAPGVPDGSLEGLISHLREVLSPPITPEFTTVKVPGSDDKMVIVIRVTADPNAWPVVCGGEVRVRNPGQSPPATHHQILDLVRRRDEPHGAGAPIVQSVGSTHRPGLSIGSPDKRGDFVVRLASAVYARSHVPPLVFGSVARRAIEEAFEESAFAALFTTRRARGSRSAPERVRLSSDDFASSYFTAHFDRPDTIVSDVIDATTGKAKRVAVVDRVSLNVRRTGNQVSFHVEAEARMPAEKDAGRQDREPRLARSELALTLVTGVEAIGRHLVPAIVGLTGGSPLSVDDVTFWVDSPVTSDLRDALDDSHAYRPSTPRLADWSAVVGQATSPDEAVEALRIPLQTFYLDMGFADEEELADADLKSARRERSSVLGTDG